MPDEFHFLEDVRANAWTGADSPVGDFAADQQYWGLKKQFPGDAGRLGLLRAPEPVDDRRWFDPAVGWGLILPDNPALDAKAKAAGEDAPTPLRALVEKRGGPILRWRDDFQEGYLRRYYDDGTAVDLSISGSPQGVDRSCIPRYLLIYGDPDTIPWRVQFLLNMSRFVGRLPVLGDDALKRYVDNLINGWPGPAPATDAPLLWTVDHGGGDITTLMRAVIGKALWRRFETDNDLGRRRWLDSADATQANLVEELSRQRPALVVTTSHGLTGPLNDATAMRNQLGELVDAGHRGLTSQALLNGWDPSGAIWYAQACCSAGSEDPSRYASLFGENDGNGQLLRGVAKVGATVAPVPKALLSAPNPIKAWIGHVEPTFNWTLYDPRNREALANAVVGALYDELYRVDAPLGWALRAVFKEAGEFFSLWQDALSKVNAGRMEYATVAKYRQLVAIDRQSLVLLGDPTVGLNA